MLLLFLGTDRADVGSVYWPGSLLAEMECGSSKRIKRIALNIVLDVMLVIVSIERCLEVFGNAHHVLKSVGEASMYKKYLEKP